MKCSIHNQTDATATCVFCGRALCPSCITTTASGRVVCSAECSTGITNTEATLASIRARTLGANRLTAYLLLGSGLLFIAFGVRRAAVDGASFITILMEASGGAFCLFGLAWLWMLKGNR